MKGAHFGWKHSPDILDRQSQISDTAGPVSFHQYVLTLQVPVSNSRFPLGAKDLCVEVTESWHRGVGEAQHGFIVQSGWFEVIIQRSIFMVISDQVELGPRAGSFDICSYETCQKKGWGMDEGRREAGDYKINLQLAAVVFRHDY